MFWSENTIDSLIDSLENIINVNIEIEQKQALLKSKVEELKRMFENKPLDELKNLKFSSDVDVTLNVKPQHKKEENIKTDGVTEKV